MNITPLISRIQISNRFSVWNLNPVVRFSSRPEEEHIPVNVLKDGHTAVRQKENGAIYDKKPFKIRLEEGKAYYWCLCGQSKGQPFCDGTHKNIFLKITQRPIRFAVAETKDYWLCNCKQTTHRPFCDGTHKKLDIQQAKK